jgi:ATP-binding cassette subfamily C exporter for protease/lipase
VLADGQVQAFGPRDQVLGALQKAAQQAQAQAAARPLQAQPAGKGS